MASIKSFDIIAAYEHGAVTFSQLKSYLDNSDPIQLFRELGHERTLFYLFAQPNERYQPFLLPKCITCDLDQAWLYHWFDSLDETHS